MRASVRMLLGVGLGLSCGAALPAAAEELTVTTYYPKPRAALGELRVKNNTLLAKNGGNVAVGWQGQPGRVPLDVNGFLVAGSTLSIAQDAFGGSPAWGITHESSQFKLLMQDGVGLAGTGVLTVTRNDKMGVGDFPAGTPPKNTLDVKGRLLVGQAYAGQEQATANGLAVENRLGIGHLTSATPLEALEVAGGVVIGSGLAGSVTAPSNGLLVQERLGIGTETPQNTLDVAGPVAVGTTYAALGALGGGVDLIVENNIAATSNIVAREGSLGGAERAFFGQSGGGPLGAGTWNAVAGVGAGAVTGGPDGTALVAGDGANPVFVARANGKTTARDTLEVDASAKTVRLTPAASLFIPAGAPAPPAKKLLVSDAVGNADWKSPSAIAALNGPNGSVTPAPPRSYNIVGSYEQRIIRAPSGVLTYVSCHYPWGEGKCSGVSGYCQSGIPGTIAFADWAGAHAMWTICAQ